MKNLLEYLVTFTISLVSLHPNAFANQSNKYGGEFVPIEPGTFVMGSALTNPQHRPDEVQHLVKITHPFEIELRSTSQREWYLVMGKNTSGFSARKYCFFTYTKVNGGGMCPNRPAESMTYGQIRKFISKLNSEVNDGYFYRLPTEAEWEYSARQGKIKFSYTGDYLADVYEPYDLSVSPLVDPLVMPHDEWPARVIRGTDYVDAIGSITFRTCGGENVLGPEGLRLVRTRIKN